MAGASRRGYGEDGIYFDHRGDCRDSALHKTCTGRWRGVVSLGFDADGKRVRRKVSGQTKAEVKDKLKALHSELDAGLRTAAGYTVEKAVADWLDEGLPGRTAKTVEANRDSLRPLLAVIGTIPLKDLTVQDVRTALKKMAATHATRTLQKAHNCLTRALRHAEGQDLVRRNVSALVDTPRGLEGRRSQSLTLAAGFGSAGGGGVVAAARVHRAVLADGGPVGGGAGADVGARGPGGRDDLGVAVGAGARRHQDEPVAADAEAAGDRRRGAAGAAGSGRLGSGPRPGSCGRSAGWC